MRLRTLCGAGAATYDGATGDSVVAPFWLPVDPSNILMRSLSEFFRPGRTCDGGGVTAVPPDCRAAKRSLTELRWPPVRVVWLCDGGDAAAPLDSSEAARAITAEPRPTRRFDGGVAATGSDSREAARARTELVPEGGLRALAELVAWLGALSAWLMGGGLASLPVGSTA